MSILNVDKIQPIGGGSTITVDATDIQATTATITASKFVGSGDLSVTGVSTFTGNIDLNADLDVDGHTNLDNVSIAGVSTFTGNIDANGDLDVDGQTNLDNVDVVGIMTVTTNTQYHGYKLSNGTNLVGELVGLSGSNDTGALALWSGGSKYVQLSAVGNSFLSGGSLGIGTIAPNLLLHLHQENSNATFAHFTNTTTGVNANQGVSFGLDSNEDATIYHYGSKNIRFATGGTEKIRIDSSGRLLIGTTTEGDADADNLTIAGSGNAGMTIRSGTTSQGAIYFSDATSGNAEFDGFIVYNQSSRNLLFGTQQATRMRIDQSGHMGLGVVPSAWPTNADYKAIQVGSGACIFGRGSGDEDRGGIGVNYYGTTSGAKYITNGHAARFYMADGNIQLQNAASNSSGAGAAMTLNTRLQIDTDGRVTLKNGGSNLASEFNSGANQFVITNNGNAGLTIDSTSSSSSSIHFADGPTGSESYRGIIEYKHSNDDMRFAVEATHVARLRKGSYSDSGGGMIIGNNDDNSDDAHSDSRTLILGATGRSETGMTLITSTSGTGKIRFSDGVQYYNQGAIGYYHNNRTVAQIPTYGESLSFVAAQKENNFVLNGNEAIRVCSDMDRQKMVDGFWKKSINTSYQTVFSIQSGYDNSSIHRGYFYEIIVFGGDWGSHSANRTYFKGFINGYDGYQGHTVIEHSGTYGSNTGGQGHYGSSQCTIEVTFTGNGNSHIQMKLSTGSVTAEGYARFIGFIRDYDGFHIR